METLLPSRKVYITLADQPTDYFVEGIFPTVPLIDLIAEGGLKVEEDDFTRLNSKEGYTGLCKEFNGGVMDAYSYPEGYRGLEFFDSVKLGLKRGLLALPKRLGLHNVSMGLSWQAGILDNLNVSFNVYQEKRGGRSLRYSYNYFKGEVGCTLEFEKESNHGYSLGYDILTIGDIQRLVEPDRDRQITPREQDLLKEYLVLTGWLQNTGFANGDEISKLPLLDQQYDLWFPS